MQFSNPGSLPSTITVSGGTITSVTNPVSTDPSSTISTVSTYVPILNRDAFYWPAISGEGLPPTKNSNITYSSRLNKACYRNGAVSPGGVPLVTFPLISRSPYDSTKKTITWQWKHLAHNAFINGATATRPIFSYGILVNSPTNMASQTPAQLGLGWGLYVGSDNKWHLVVSNGVATKTDIATTAGTFGVYTLDTFHLWEVSCSDTQTTVKLDGVLVGTASQGWSLSPTIDPNLGFMWSGDPNSISSTTNDCLTEILATYA